MSETQIGSFLVADKLDQDHELKFTVGYEERYLHTNELRALHDHIGQVLTDAGITHTLIGYPETFEKDQSLVDAIGDLTEAVRALQPTTKIEPVCQEQPIEKKPEPEVKPERQLGVGTPRADDDPTEWNTAAFNYAFEHSRTVHFKYRKPGSGNFGLPVQDYDRILPVQPVQVTGPAHDPYKAVLVRDYAPDDSYVLKTFRLDRILQYVEINEG
jgi:hypothetical protein